MEGSLSAEVLRTPSSRDFLQVTPRASSVESVKTGILSASNSGSFKRNLEKTVQMREEKSLPVSSPTPSISCPGTTIINPRALLLRYEEKLKKSKDALLTVVHSSYVPPKNKCRNSESLVFEGTEATVQEKLSSKSDENIAMEEKAASSFDRQVGDRLRKRKCSDTQCHPKLPNKVIINPLDYLRTI